MNGLISTIIVALVLVLPTQAETTQESDFKKTLTEFIDLARENNPGILEAKNNIRAFKETPPQAGSLDDPQLIFGLMNMPVDTFDLNQEAMTQKQITITQRFPFPGKLGLRTEIAMKNIEVAESNLDELTIKIESQVKQSFYELCFILAAIDITRQNKILLEQFVTIAESKYSVGKGIQQDVIKAQVELSKIMDELIRLNQLRETEQGRLNTLMNRLPQAPLSIPHGITKTGFPFTIEDLQALALEHRPILRELQIIKERFIVAKQLAEKEYYPNFQVGFRYGQREDGPREDHPDFVSAFVGVNIPIWHETKQSRKVAEEAHRVEQVKEAFNKTKNQVFLQIKTLVDEEKRGAETLKLIDRGILPQARQSLEAALAGYPVDKVDFLTLLDNQVTLFKWQIQYHRELTDYEKNLAEIENTVGKSLF